MRAPLPPHRRHILLLLPLLPRLRGNIKRRNTEARERGKIDLLVSGEVENRVTDGEMESRASDGADTEAEATRLRLSPE